MVEEKISELKKRVDEQRKALGSLAEILEGEDRFKDLREREKPCEAFSSLAAAVSGEGFVLSWPETRHLFDFSLDTIILLAYFLQTTALFCSLSSIETLWR